MCVETPIDLVASAIVRVHPHAHDVAEIYRLEEALGLSALRANDATDRDSAIEAGFHLALGTPIPSAEAVVYCEIDYQDDDDAPAGWVTPSHCKTGSSAIDSLPDHRCAVLFGDLPVHDRIVHVHVVRVDVRAPQRMSPMLRPLAGLTEESLHL